MQQHIPVVWATWEEEVGGSLGSEFQKLPQQQVKPCHEGQKESVWKESRKGGKDGGDREGG